MKVTIPSALVTLAHALVSKQLSTSTSTSQSAFGWTIQDTINLSSISDDAGADAVAPLDTTAFTTATVSMATAQPVPDTVRAHAFITLGKLCLRDGALAKRVVHMLVRELRDVSSSVTVRSNVLLVLCDLCVRYTAVGTCVVPLCMLDTAA